MNNHRAVPAACRTWARALWLAWGGLCCVGTALAGIEVVDDAGRTVRLAGPARRIVSLAPNVTELLFAAGAGPRVVGVMRFSDYPVAARRLPVVGDYAGIDIERIVALKPDLVIAWQSGNPPAALVRLRGLGLTVFESDPKTIPDVADSLERFGRLAGTGTIALDAGRAFRRRYEALAVRYRASRPVKVFFEVWDAPLTTVSRRHLIGNVLELCGATNIFADLPGLTPAVSLEAVLRAGPQAVVSAGSPESLFAWRRWSSLPAVRYGNLITIDGDLISRNGPRILDAADQLCARLDQARAKLPY